MATPPSGIKHWRSFGADDWRHVRDGLLGALVGGLLPVVLYIVTINNWCTVFACAEPDPGSTAQTVPGFRPAVLVVLTWSALVFVWHWRRTRSVDVFSATAFILYCTKAAAGLITGNEWLYFAWASLENVMYGTVFLVSALFGKPVVALYFQRLYPVPDHLRRTITWRKAFVVVSAAWFCGHLLRGVVRLWLLDLLPREVFLFVDTVAGWPITIPLTAFTAWYPLRQLRRAGQDLAPQPMTTLDALELGIEESAPSTV